jgi:hypothetical protein
MPSTEDVVNISVVISPKFNLTEGENAKLYDASNNLIDANVPIAYCGYEPSSFIRYKICSNNTYEDVNLKFTFASAVDLSTAGWRYFDDSGNSWPATGTWNGTHMTLTASAVDVDIASGSNGFGYDTVSGIKIYVNGTGNCPNMTTGVHYVDYTYEDAAYLASADQRNLSALILIIYLAGVVFMIYTMYSSGMDVTEMITVAIAVVIISMAVLPVLTDQVFRMQQPQSVGMEAINFTYNNTYYPTAHSPVHEIIAMYNDTGQTCQYNSGLYDFIK